MPDNPDYSDAGIRELVRVLDAAVRAGVSNLALEYKGRELMVFHQAGTPVNVLGAPFVVGIGAARIPKDLQQVVIDEMVKRAGLARKRKGKMPITLLDREFEVRVEIYDSFGESAFRLTLKEKKKKAGG
jgi:hypothetical protein